MGRRWPAFEAVLHGFEPRRVRTTDDEAPNALTADRRLTRHCGRIRPVRDSAAAMRAPAEAHGCTGTDLAAWPGERANRVNRHWIYISWLFFFW